MTGAALGATSGGVGSTGDERRGARGAGAAFRRTGRGRRWRQRGRWWIHGWWRHHPGRRREQCAGGHGARAGLQQHSRDRREARQSSRAGVRGGADRRSQRRSRRRVRHPVAIPPGCQQHQFLRGRRHQFRRARLGQQHHRYVAQPRQRRATGSILASFADRSPFPGWARSPISLCWCGRCRGTARPTSWRRRTCSRSTTRKRRSSSGRTCRSSPASMRRQARRRR